MNDRERQFSHEIASLQTRVGHLTSTYAAADRVMSSLAVQTDAARLEADAPSMARLNRKMELVRHRLRAVANEIGVLEQLIAARRRLGG